MSFQKIIVAIAVIVLIISPFIVFPRVLVIRNVICQSQFGPCSQSIEEEVTKIKDSNLLETRQEIKDYIERSPYTKEYSLQMKFPSTLIVNVIERKPKYAILHKDAGKYSLIDKSGKVMSTEDYTALPLLIISSELPKTGEVVSDEILFALEIIYDIFASYKIKTGIIENDSLNINLTDGFKIIFPLSGERQVLLGSMNVVLTRLNSLKQDSKIEEDTICSSSCTIDLRFKNPVLREN